MNTKQCIEVLKLEKLCHIEKDAYDIDVSRALSYALTVLENLTEEKIEEIIDNYFSIIFKKGSGKDLAQAIILSTCRMKK